jgi:NHLM bacteriocin system ABC transporter ATP-binding protein
MLLAGGLAGVFGMAVPLATAQIIDEVFPSAEVGLLFQTGAILAVFAIASALVQVVRGATALRVETRSSARLQAAVWDRLLRLPVEFFRAYSAGDLAMRANGINAIRRALSGTAIAAILSGLFSLLNFLVMIRIDPGLAFLAGALSLGSVAAAAGLGGASVLIHRSLARVDGRLSSLVVQILGGVSKLKVASAERRAFSVWSQLYAEKRTLALRIMTLEGALGVFNAAYPILVLLVVFASASERRQGTLGTGAFLGFNAALTVFAGGLVALVDQAIELLRLLPQYERVRPILEAVPEVDDRKSTPGQLKGHIQMSRVSFRYSAEGQRVLDEVDIDITPGEFVAIVGSSGAGKSTVLRLLLGFERPESGGVFYDGQDLATLDVIAVRRQIGVVLQNGVPASGSIGDNILRSRQLGKEALWEAAGMAGLAEDIQRMPMKMQTVLSQGGGGLSGGQRQRLLVAAALVTKPKIIFFDEATSALDNHAQSTVTESLERLRATRVVIAHRLTTIRNADRILVLHRGKLAESGSYDELMKLPKGIFAGIAKRQIA